MAVARARLIATDLDGTLQRADRTISGRTRGAPEHAHAAGVVLPVVTARPPRFPRRLAGEVGLAGLVVCCYGALIYDLDRHRVVRHAPLAGNVVSRLIVALRATVPILLQRRPRALTGYP